MTKSVDKCPAYRIISAACDGSEKSVEKLLKFYDAYISKASLRPLYDDFGKVYIAVDMELKGRIREAIMQMVKNFDMEIK